MPKTQWATAAMRQQQFANLFNTLFVEIMMSDILPGNSDDPDALPLNERSSAFIDGAAFINFVRLKSRVAPQEGSEEKSAATRAGVSESLKAPCAEPGNAVARFTTDAELEVEIQDEDWDSLFGAIEERLRGTVDTLDSATLQIASQDKLSRIKSVVLDCVSSLDALHQALRHDRGLHVASRPGRISADIRSASRPTGPNDPNRKH